MSKRRFGHIRQLPSGRWQASYIGPDKLRYRAPHTFPTESAATKWVRFEEALIETGQWFAEREHTTPLFGDYCEQFIDTQTTRTGELLKPTTKHHYRNLLRVHLQEFHRTPLHKIDTPTIRTWWAEAIADGKLTSRSRAYKLLSSTMSRAVEDKLLSHNPCTIKGAHSAETGKKIVVPTADKLARIIKCINPRYRVMAILIANSGLRFEEAAALKRSGVTMTALDGQPVYAASAQSIQLLKQNL